MNLKEKKNKTIGAIAAIQTLTENYPVLLTTDLNDLLSMNLSLGFIMALLGMCGVTEKRIIDWLVDICGDTRNSDGLLSVLEYAIKVLLEANIKNITTCAIDPILPDNLMLTYNDITGDEHGGTGIEINLDAVDMTGILNYCPYDANEGIFYFDGYESMYYEKESDRIAHGFGEEPNNLWQSLDFNAFLWYVINKGTLEGGEKYYSSWDNRIWQCEKYYEGRGGAPTGRSEYFAAENPAEMALVKKKRYIYCKYVERDSKIYGSNVLKIYLEPDRYYHKRKIKGIDKDIWFNRTIFEFNHDFIWSLKLFDTKTLLANVVHSLISLSSTVSLEMKPNFKMVELETKVRALIDKVLKSENMEEIPDDYYTFSNDEYDAILEEANKRYNGIYQEGESAYSNLTINDVNNLLTGITNAGNLVESKQAIANTIYALGNLTNKEDEIRKNMLPVFGVTFNVNTGLIQNFIKELCTQLILSVLTPKIAILYAVNAQVMGGEAANIFKAEGWNDFIKNFGNLFVVLIKRIYSIIMERLLKFLLDILKPLFELFISKLLLETIRDYMELISNLIRLCNPLNFTFGNKNVLPIDNVLGADIIPALAPSSKS